MNPTAPNDQTPFANNPPEQLAPVASPQPQAEPIEANASSILTPPPSDKPASKKKMFAGVFGVLLLVAGVVAGVLLVNRSQDIRQKAGGNWSIVGTSNFSNCSGTNCTLTQGASCSGMTGTLFHCPNGLNGGRCLENAEGLGGFSLGQTVDLVNIASRKDCGAVQIDFNAPGTPAGSGNCGAATLTTGSVCGSSGGGGGTTSPTSPPTIAPTPTATPRPAICGEACTSDADCGEATGVSIDVVCRNNQCVNRECYDRGGETTPGTICSCSLSTGQCGESCGSDIGLCDEGFFCVYPSQNQCGTNRGVCLPDSGRGPMTQVPTYEDENFVVNACGPTTNDPDNNYLSHPSFPNYTFTNEEVYDYICTTPTPSPTATPTAPPVINPTPTSTPTVAPTATPTMPPGSNITAMCIDIRAYDDEWNE